MFEHNEQLESLVTSILGRVAGLDRGDVIPLSLIESEAAVQRYTELWGQLIVKLKRRMLDERHICLWSIRNVGYKLCTRTEQINFTAIKRQQRAVRQLSRSVREVGAVPAAELALHLQQVRALRLRHMTAARRLLKRQLREQRNEIRKSDTIPTIASAWQPQVEQNLAAG